jgi:hypothetical protein
LAKLPAPSSFALPEPADTFPERRTSLRQLLRKHSLVQFQVKPCFTPEWAVLHDVSPQGVGLLVGAPLPPGTTLYVQLHPWHQEGIPINRVVGVVHAAPDGTLGWRVGCAFAPRLDDVDLLCILADAGR